MKKIITFILVGIIIGGLAAYGVIRYLTVQRAETEIARLVMETPAIEDVRYGKLSIGLIQSTFDMRDIQLQLTEYAEPILIDSLHIDVTEADKRIPPNAEARIDGIHLNTQHGLLDPIRADLESMGYRDMNGVITLAYSYDRENKRLDLNDVTIGADQMGSVRFDLGLTNLDLEQVISQNSKPNVSALLMTMPMAGLAGGQLTYRDDSFFNRALKHSHKQSGGSPDDYRSRAKKTLKTLFNDHANDRVRRILTTLEDFIDHPQKLTISLNPTKPVPFLRFLLMKKPVDYLELLNVTVSN